MSIPKKGTAIVVHSGGQDSTTCLGVALKRHEKVVAVGFDYGQKHSVELAQAQLICDLMGVEFMRIDIGFLNTMTSALTSNGNVDEEHTLLAGRPASFVPARNAMFLTMAFGVAMELNADAIYTGVCQTDYSGYPDCRDMFIKQLNLALNTGYEREIQIMTPLMWLTKAETFDLARRYGVLDMVLEHSHTCYNGDHGTKNDWGYGCGECGACKLRAKGYNEYIENLGK